MAENTSIYVGNLDYTITEDELKNIFSEFGEVDSVRLITDKASGKSKGYGFVEMTSDENANAAIEALSGKEYKDREMKVNAAKPKTERPRKGGRGGFGGRPRSRGRGRGSFGGGNFRGRGSSGSDANGNRRDNNRRSGRSGGSSRY